MNKILQTYLTIVATLIMLFMAATLIVFIYVAVEVSHKIAAFESKADDVTSKIDSFNTSVKDLNSSVQKVNPFN